MNFIKTMIFALGLINIGPNLIYASSSRPTNNQDLGAALAQGCLTVFYTGLFEWGMNKLCPTDSVIVPNEVKRTLQMLTLSASTFAALSHFVKHKPWYFQLSVQAAILASVSTQVIIRTNYVKNPKSQFGLQERPVKRKEFTNEDSCLICRETVKQIESTDVVENTNTVLFVTDCCGIIICDLCVKILTKKSNGRQFLTQCPHCRIEHPIILKTLKKDSDGEYQRNHEASYIVNGVPSN